MIIFNASQNWYVEVECNIITYMDGLNSLAISCNFTLCHCMKSEDFQRRFYKTKGMSLEIGLLTFVGEQHGYCVR